MLTEERQKLASANEKLIYYVLRRMKCEEYYGAAAIGLCGAAEKWDNTKSAFSTFAVKVIRNEVLGNSAERKDIHR